MAERKKQETLVYCGPSVRGVAKQYTVYAGTLPNALKNLMARYPMVKMLCVSLDDFARIRAALADKNSAEYKVYRAILKEL